MIFIQNIKQFFFFKIFKLCIFKMFLVVLVQELSQIRILCFYFCVCYSIFDLVLENLDIYYKIDCNCVILEDIMKSFRDDIKLE